MSATDRPPLPTASVPGHRPAGSAAAAHVPGTLHKAVQALAIEPLSMALSVTGRKAYDVMIWLAQRGTPGPDGGYASPVSAILQGFGSSTKASERVQRYIEQMVQTTVIWRPLAPGDATTLTLDGIEPPPAGTDGPRRGDEARTFPLLAEARLYKRAGEWWVTWYYPPSIREELVSPTRWAQIDFDVLRQLNTYCAVTLYEICARYRDSPAGVTGSDAEGRRRYRLTGQKTATLAVPDVTGATVSRADVFSGVTFTGTLTCNPDGSATVVASPTGATGTSPVTFSVSALFTTNAPGDCGRST